ncbi:hypothetical protein PENSPDRAFT_655273 [Peniophora sp. CONT]|nr:hypothetical protein PENSPDRAFT_655273 [Peniophora sp. CONT]
MPQAPSRPPPYSIECSSFPPPIQAASGAQAWAFQRAFESAREPIRWAILTTMLCWANEWRYKGAKIPRQFVQHAYDQAPLDLKAALDYILENSLPFYMIRDRDRRRHNLYRTGRVEEVETSVLSHADFARLYNDASKSVREAVAATFDSWTLFEDHELISAVSQDGAAQAYTVASDSLKVVVSWMLETGYDIEVSNGELFQLAKANFHRASVNTATAHIELHAMNRLKGLY